MVGSKRLSLRLDDGSIIRHSPGDGSLPIKITVARALELGKAGEREAQRLEQLIATARSLMPRANGEPNFTPPAGAAKRARVDSGHLTDVSLMGDWMAKCKTIVDKLGKSFGPQHKNVFWVPVNAKFLPDYYTIVKNPMFFCQIEDRLNKRKYTSPEQFNADVRLAFDNCKLYNPVNDPFRKLGEKVEAEYDQLWVASGLADSETMEARGKRATAGIARPKYEPEKFEAPSKPKEQGGKGPRPAGKNKGGSHEVTSGGRGAPKEAPISDARKHEMGELLVSEEMGAHMEALTQLLPPELLEGADGEFELDFENLDDGTVRKIDQFLRGIFGPPAEEAAQASMGSPNPSVQPSDDDVSEGDLDDADDSSDD